MHTGAVLLREKLFLKFSDYGYASSKDQVITSS